MRQWRVASATCHILILISSSAQATPHAVDGKLCSKACRQTFRTLRFADAPDAPYFALQECRSLLYQKSVHLCWDMHCAEEVWLAESRAMNQTCQDISGSHFPPHDIVDGLSDKDIAQIARFNATSPDRVHYFDVLMLPSQAFYELWGRTLDAHDYVWDYHYYYGWAMGIFWAVVVVVGIANRALAQWGTLLAPLLTSQDPSGAWVKRHILTPATFGWRCVQPFGGWGTLPPRVQTLTLTLFLLLNIGCTLHGYRIFEGYIYYPSVGMQILRHISDRTGVISFANFPLIWLFGMRNNLVIWLTGWDFKTYNNFHRWVARIATLQAAIHSIGYSALILRKGGWDYFWRMCNLTYWWTGELATIFMCLLVGLSVFWFRRRQYEVFLVLHIALSVLILVTMLGHVSIFKGDYDPLVWAPFAIWLLDRALRGARIVAFSPRFWNASASITYNEDAYMIRVVVPASSSLYKIEPGTFYYLMVLNKWGFWESHPFTVAWVSGSTQYDTESAGENSPLLRDGTNSSEETRAQAEKFDPEMTFLIRPYRSFTLRLKEYAEMEQPKPATVRVAIDGPYGEPLPLERFTTVLFVAGGSGIAVPLSYLNRLTTSYPQPTRIHVHWAVRQLSLAVDVLNRELSGALKSPRVKINIYVTGDDNRRIRTEAVNPLVRWDTRRLNVEEAIEEALHKEDEGSLAIVTSGPGSMADDSRCAVAARIAHSLPHIEYFEESFQW